MHCVRVSQAKAFVFDDELFDAVQVRVACVNSCIRVVYLCVCAVECLCSRRLCASMFVQVYLCGIFFF